MGHRARAFKQHLDATFDVQIAYRQTNKLRAVWNFFTFLRQAQPVLTYVFDVCYSGVLGAVLYRVLRGNRLVIETGDAVYALARSMGLRGPVGLLLTFLLEQVSFHLADRIVVRGTFHRRWLARKGFNCDVIQDGVDTKLFRPIDVSDLRRRLGLEGVLTVGLIGSSVWSQRLEMCYGWELVEVVRLLKDEPVVGIFIGGGSGIDFLKARCEKYGITDRVRFWPHIAYGELAATLNLFDVCLSTQTNDLVGQVRTTGKLPLYMATGRFVLASDVGEAALVLPEEMLVSYVGVKDESYPPRLAKKITELIRHPARLTRGRRNVAIAKERFEYAELAERLATVIKLCCRPLSRRSDGRVALPTPRES